MWELNAVYYHVYSSHMRVHASEKSLCSGERVCNCLRMVSEVCAYYFLAFQSLIVSHTSHDAQVKSSLIHFVESISVFKFSKRNFCCVVSKMFESVNISNVHNNNSCLLFKNANRLKFPYKIKSVDAPINKLLLRDFTGTTEFC